MIKIKNFKSILSNALGNTLEWYDFGLYATFAPILGKIFFPADNPAVSTMATFAVFAVGFLMRPIGGLIYSHIGDTRGRRVSLLVSVLLMTLPTMMIGLLSGYDRIGIFAPILLILMRLLQGLAVGGEFMGSVTALVESAPTGKRGFFGSFAFSGVLLGILLGFIVSGLSLHFFHYTEYHGLGWRIPFLLGGVFGIVIYILRRSLLETTVFLNLEKKSQLVKLPIVEAVLHHKEAIAKGIGITILNATGFYILMVYLITFFTSALKMPRQQAVFINAGMIFAAMVLTPLFGSLSDRIGRKAVMLISALGFMLCIYPIGWLVLHMHVGFTFFLILQAIMAALLSLLLGPLGATLCELFTTRVRYTGIAIAYNFTIVCFGGTMPLLITYIVYFTHQYDVLNHILFYAAGITVITLQFMRETYKQPL